MLPTSHAAAAGRHPLLERYCTISGLTSAAGKRLNGRCCLVVSVDDEGGTQQQQEEELSSTRLGVLLVDAIPTTCTTKNSNNTTNIGDKTSAANECVVPIDSGNASSSPSSLVSIKAANLCPIYDVAVLPSPVGGSGLFAQRAFATGDVLIAERPLAVAASFSADAIHAAVGDGRCSAAQRRALEGLTLAPAAAPLPPAWRTSEWVRRFANNCISLDDGTAAVGLFAVLCRANHCCALSALTTVEAEAPAVSPEEASSTTNQTKAVSPHPHPQHNARWAWDRTLRAQILTAARPIAYGEEIFTDYISDAVWGEDRAATLAAHGIGTAATGCGCVACDPPLIVQKHLAAYNDAKRRLLLSSSAASSSDATTPKKRTSSTLTSTKAKSTTLSATATALSSAEAEAEALTAVADGGLRALAAIEARARGGATTKSTTTASTCSSGNNSGATKSTPNAEKELEEEGPLANLKSLLLMNLFQCLLRIRKGEEGKKVAEKAMAGEEGADALTLRMRVVAGRVKALRLTAVGGNAAHPYMALVRQMEAAL